jgi:hypothetical protein
VSVSATTQNSFPIASSFTVKAAANGGGVQTNIRKARRARGHDRMWAGRCVAVALDYVRSYDLRGAKSLDLPIQPFQLLSSGIAR